ncbi:hypothetical protein [Dysgonomonas macrotermitis]|uniref:Beta-lactamase-inhibitor-like, PepSY-like n=1 Tax=Dysgonomonas macrotermitis TaxID=1346286 RepID=A0A1M5I1R7_9BACT|nr:hypothetical protein [Dysgonomonas macrotermitis]SHG22087.1 hypothetical protein SAMN05444362_1186 [Dysgonomonas macrotermitis]
MKSFLFIAVLLFGCATMQAESSFATGNSTEFVTGRYDRGRYYQKGNMDARNLPSNITKYLKKNYGDYDIMVAKRKGNGYYYLKISYPGNNYRPYYRSLVFDEKGKIVKG